MRSVAIIEAGCTLSTTISAALRAEGLQPVSLRGWELADGFAGRTFALLLVDLMALSEPFEFCRSARLHQPIIAVAHQGDVDAQIQALEAGADDCVSRSINARELLARIRNVLRRADGHDPLFTAVLDSVRSMRIRIGDQIHDLSRGEAEVLSLLIEHAPTPLTIDQIAELLRGSPNVKRGTISSRLKSLRRKLGPDVIEVRPGFGYQLTVCHPER